MILHHYIWGDIDIDIVEEVAPHFLIAKHYGNLALFCRLTKHQSHYFRNSDKRFYAAGFDDEGKSMNPSDEYIPFVPDILYDDDGIGYLCHYAGRTANQLCLCGCVQWSQRCDGL